MGEDKEKIIFTIRTDKTQMKGQSPFLYIKDAVLFKSSSTENVEYAKKHGVWQVIRKVKQLKKGHRVFLKDLLNGSIWDLGIVIDTSEVSPIEDWPDRWWVE